MSTRAAVSWRGGFPRPAGRRLVLVLVIAIVSQSCAHLEEEANQFGVGRVFKGLQPDCLHSQLPRLFVHIVLAGPILEIHMPYIPNYVNGLMCARITRTCVNYLGTWPSSEQAGGRDGSAHRLLRIHAHVRTQTSPAALRH